MENRDEVALSFGRCITRGDVVGRFYELLTGSHPDIRRRFEKTDFDSQKHLLRQGVNLVLMFANDLPVGRSGLARIRKSHSSSALNIPPEFYPYWKSSLLDAVSEFDPEFSDALRLRWAAVLQKGIDYVAGGFGDA